MFIVCFLPEGMEIYETPDLTDEIERMLAVRKK